MKQEDKELLLKDLCARLPYGVKVHINIPEMDYSTEELIECESDKTLSIEDIDWLNNDCGEIKPYLRPMSSMTEKEKKDLLNYVVGKKGIKYFQILTDGSIDSMDAKVQNAERLSLHWVNFDKETTSRYIGWLLKYHFDFMDLIPKGLALEAPKGMYD